MVTKSDSLSDTISNVFRYVNENKDSIKNVVDTAQNIVGVASTIV